MVLVDINLSFKEDITITTEKVHQLICHVFLVHKNYKSPYTVNFLCTLTASVQNT